MQCDAGRMSNLQKWKHRTYVTPFRRAGNGRGRDFVEHREHVPAWRSNIAIRRRGRLSSASSWISWRSCSKRHGGGGEHQGSLVHRVCVRREAGLIQADGNAHRSGGTCELDHHWGAIIAVGRPVVDDGPDCIVCGVDVVRAVFLQSKLGHFL